MHDKIEAEIQAIITNNLFINAISVELPNQGKPCYRLCEGVIFSFSIGQTVRSRKLCPRPVAWGVGRWDKSGSLDERR
jgi:hypothetical protein